MRRATWRCQPGLRGCPISIHALLAESDQAAKPDIPGKRRFLSTLSLRRATGRVHYGQRCHPDFYPRSPCGERRRSGCGCFLPPSNFYPRSPCGERHLNGFLLKSAEDISIHALLAESDIRLWGCFLTRAGFLSTLSLRRATQAAGKRRHDRSDFYPRSPCGERLNHAVAVARRGVFLSTLSLRRATQGEGRRSGGGCISIHALLAESDARQRGQVCVVEISIHALLAESD